MKRAFVKGSMCELNIHNEESISLCEAIFLASGSSENKRKGESQCLCGQNKYQQSSFWI